MRHVRSVAFLALIFLAERSTTAEGPGPAVTVRLGAPDRQAEELIGLFRGAKVADPAAALAAWKRASREPDRLGKPLEAAIAAINPRMARELRSLDGAEVAFWPSAEGPRFTWGALLPDDDGTFAALGSALVLTDGAVEEPLEGLAVDRLGRPGSPLLVNGPRGLFLGGTREGLRASFGRARAAADPEDRPGIHLGVTPEILRAPRSLAGRRVAKLFQDRAFAGLDLDIVIVDGSSRASLLGRMLAPGPAAATVEPGWLDLVPADRAMAAFALAIDPRAAAWDDAFALADRVERVDPARDALAPLRLRLELVARAVGVRTERDVLPHLKGVSGWAGSVGKRVDSALVAVHLDDEAAAARLASGIKPPTVAGRPVRVVREGSSVWLAWGDRVFEASRDARARPGGSAGPTLREGWDRPAPSFSGGVWPGRVPGLAPSGSPLAEALDHADPLIVQGSIDPGGLVRASASWRGLRRAVSRFLDLIPLDPPPDR